MTSLSRHSDIVQRLMDLHAETRALIEELERCPVCRGSGLIESTNPRYGDSICVDCDGKGRLDHLLFTDEEME